jgi:Tol biopolymer transport system component
MRGVVLLFTAMAAVLATGTAGLVATEEPAEASFPGENGKIAFSSDRDGDFDIYTIRPDGSGLRRVTNSPSSDSCPEWSPDGTKIAFDSDRDGDREIYVKDLATGKVKKLTDNTDPRFPGLQADQSPAWSPDGTRIAFSSNRDTLDELNGEAYAERIYVMKADGSEVTRLTRSFYYYESDISWSPDGTQLVFEVGFDATYDLVIMNADGSDRRFLLPMSVVPDERYPDWSPSGEKIVFTKGVDGGGGDQGTMDIWKMDPDGSDQKRLTKTPKKSESAPDWSPGGGKNVFERKGDLIKMRASDGSNKTNLTNTPSYVELDPDWKAKPSR